MPVPPSVRCQAFVLEIPLMGHQELLERIKAEIGDRIASVDETSPKRMSLYVSAEDNFEANRFLFEDCGGRFIIATGIDTRDDIEVLYHYSFDSLQTVVTVKTKAPKPFPELESITPFCAGAEWIEREIHDLLGVEFRNHPNLERLILADDWPEGVYPLRRDFRPEDAGLNEAESE